MCERCLGWLAPLSLQGEDYPDVINTILAVNHPILSASWLLTWIVWAHAPVKNHYTHTLYHTCQCGGCMSYISYTSGWRTDLWWIQAHHARSSWHPAAFQICMSIFVDFQCTPSGRAAAKHTFDPYFGKIALVGFQIAHNWWDCDQHIQYIYNTPMVASDTQILGFYSCSIPEIWPVTIHPHQQMDSTSGAHNVMLMFSQAV